MKRLIAIFMLTAILLSMAGCMAKAPESTAPPTEPVQNEPPTTGSTEPAGTASQEPLFSVSVPVISECSYADDGVLLFTHSYQVMSLILPDPEVADKVIVDFLNKTEEAANSALELYISAHYSYDGSDSWIPYACSLIYDPVRIDQGVLSLYGIYSSYNGASHPSHLNVSANYDLITGDFLTLDRILAEGVTWEDVCSLLINTLTDIKDDAQLYDSFVQKVQDTFRRDFIGYKNWYFSEKGLCFYFSPYEIAPYSSGTVVAQIPYSTLLGTIDDQYFPPEQVSDGDVHALRFEEADMSAFTQTCEVTTDDGGQKVIIHSGDTAVSNVKLIQGSWDEAGVTFLPTATILACATLTPGDAIMVETFIPDVMPNLLLQYTSGGITHSRYIFQSGEDGSILLLDE